MCYCGLFAFCLFFHSFPTPEMGGLGNVSIWKKHTDAKVVTEPGCRRRAAIAMIACSGGWWWGCLTSG